MIEVTWLLMVVLATRTGGRCPRMGQFGATPATIGRTAGDRKGLPGRRHGWPSETSSGGTGRRRRIGPLCPEQGFSTTVTMFAGPQTAGLAEAAIMPTFLEPKTERAFLRFREACAADPRVAAAFLGGSFAAGTADQFSDLDLYVIVADEVYAGFFADRHDFLGKLGEPVFREDFNGFGFDMVIFVLASGVEGEIAFGRTSGFDHLHGGPFEPVIDRAGVLRGKIFSPRQLSDAERLQPLGLALTWFWRDAAHFVRAIARDRRWAAYGFLEKMRHACVDLIVLGDEAQPGANEGWEALEGTPDDEVRTLLRASCGPLERDAMLTAAQALSEVVMRLGLPLIEEYGLTMPEAFAAMVRHRLADLAAPTHESPHGIESPTRD